MDEARAREISLADNVEEYTHEELSETDRWVKDHTLSKLSYLIRDIKPRELREWIMTCARVHYGSVETDRMLTELECYPRWLLEHYSRRP